MRGSNCVACRYGTEILRGSECGKNGVLLRRPGSDSDLAPCCTRTTDAVSLQSTLPVLVSCTRRDQGKERRREQLATWRNRAGRDIQRSYESRSADQWETGPRQRHRLWRHTVGLSSERRRGTETRQHSARPRHDLLARKRQRRIEACLVEGQSRMRLW